MRSRTLPTALDDTFPAFLTVRSQTSSQEALKHTAEHSFQYTPNCTRWHTPSLLDYTLTSNLSWRSQVQAEFVLKYTSRHTPKDTPNCTRLYTPSLRDLFSQVSSQDAPKYTLSALQSTPPSMFSRTLPNMLSRTLLISLDGTLLACLVLRSQVHFQEARHSRSCFTICFYICCLVLDPETCWVAGARDYEVGGGWPMVVGGKWRMAYGGWNSDTGRYHSLKFIFTATTVTRSQLVLGLKVQVDLWVTCSRPPNASQNPPHHALWVHLWVQLGHSHQLHRWVTRSRAPNPSPNASRNRYDLGLQVNLPVTWSRAPNASPNVSPNLLDPGFQVHLRSQLNYGLQVHLWVTWSPAPNASPSESPNSLDLVLHVNLWVTRSRPPNAFPYPLNLSLQVDHWVQLNLGLQVRVQTRLIVASKYISQLTPSRPPRASLSQIS